MNKKFENICKMSQAVVKKYATKQLGKTHTDITVGDGFVFAKGTFPVLLVAHMDTVHKKLPKLIVYEEEGGVISAPNGIGGDDRCGIYMILEIINHYNCSVLFCEDEEVGGIGARKFIETDLAKELAESSAFNYAIELDRKGSKDAVFYDCDNEEFEEFITSDFYKTAYGSFSDISVVAPFLKCAAVNLSCGYYNAHTTDEYVELKEMERGIEEVCNILERTTEEDKFEYIECVRSYSNYAYRSSFFNKGGNSSLFGYNASWYDEYEDIFTVHYIIEYSDENGHVDWFETFATSEAEAIGRLLTQHQTLCYGNIIDIMTDRTY